MKNSNTQLGPFHEVALEQVRRSVEQDEAAHAIALLHTIAKIDWPEETKYDMQFVLCDLVEVNSFQEWVEESGVIDEDVQVVMQLIGRFGGQVLYDKREGEVGGYLRAKKCVPMDVLSREKLRQIRALPADSAALFSDGQKPEFVSQRGKDV